MGVPVAVGAQAVDGDAPVVVDALVGYGLTGPLTGTAADLAAVTDDVPTVVSLDVPSGLDATIGDAPGAAVAADCVLTLALPKTGLVDLAAVCLLADIGLPAGVYERLDIPVFEFADDVVRVDAT